MHKYFMLIILLLIIFGCKEDKKETKTNNSVDIKKEIFLQHYQAEWWVVNEMPKSDNVDENIKKNQEEKEKILNYFMKKYNLTKEELENIIYKSPNDWSSDGFIKCKSFQKELGNVPRNYPDL